MDRRVKPLMTKCMWCSRVREGSHWRLERRVAGAVQYSQGICSDCLYVNFREVVTRLSVRLKAFGRLRTHLKQELRRPHVFTPTTH